MKTRNTDQRYTEEFRKKMSDTAKKYGFGKWMKGRKIPRAVVEKARRSNTGKKRSIEIRRKMCASQRRVVAEGRHHLWRGGVSKVNRGIDKQFRETFEYKIWRESVFKRDNYTCIWCGTKSGNGKRVVLNADHIKPFILYPELRLSIDNGRTLCQNCHRTTETYGSRARNFTEK